MSIRIAFVFESFWILRRFLYIPLSLCVALQDKDVIYYVTAYNENMAMPEKPEVSRVPFA